MANISAELKEFEQKTGELIQAAVVGRHDARKCSEPLLPDENILLTREDALAKLDQEYDNGYGGADCYPMYAWTQNWVLWIGEYDGATGLSKIPRNPMPCEPDFSGSEV